MRPVLHPPPSAYQTATIFVTVTPGGKFTLVQVAVELPIVPESAPHMIVESGPLSEVRYSEMVVLVGIFCAAIATVTGVAELIVTSGTVWLACGYWGAATPATLVTCIAGAPDGSGGA